MEEYKVNIYLILEIFHEVDIIILIKKLLLFVEKIEFLGYIISSDGLEVAASKIEKILDWSVPCNIVEIRAFLDLINYIDGFIPGFIQYSSLLSGFTKKDIEFEWKEI
jgi:hypothetical protein